MSLGFCQFRRWLEKTELAKQEFPTHLKPPGLTDDRRVELMKTISQWKEQHPVGLPAFVPLSTYLIICLFAPLSTSLSFCFSPYIFVPLNISFLPLSFCFSVDIFLFFPLSKFGLFVPLSTSLPLCSSIYISIPLFLSINLCLLTSFCISVSFFSSLYVCGSLYLSLHLSLSILFFSHFKIIFGNFFFFR